MKQKSWLYIVLICKNIMIYCICLYKNFKLNKIEEKEKNKEEKQSM